eukprot:TRINITY_DN1360_c0_g1_i1.p1 TRINITY_DN1360_c0_g1~~TRINITY_DN1360_c0_g1_i1.p1  ORF type:complete len:565 (+),score=144.07 TRINITY_DN1360_c0_g1_i1:75-1769(+)
MCIRDSDQTSVHKLKNVKKVNVDLKSGFAKFDNEDQSNLEQCGGKILCTGLRNVLIKDYGTSSSKNNQMSILSSNEELLKEDKDSVLNQESNVYVSKSLQYGILVFDDLVQPTRDLSPLVLKGVDRKFENTINIHKSHVPGPRLPRYVSLLKTKQRYSLDVSKETQINFIFKLQGADLSDYIVLQVKGPNGQNKKFLRIYYREINEETAIKPILLTSDDIENIRDYQKECAAHTLDPRTNQAEIIINGDPNCEVIVVTDNSAHIILKREISLREFLQNEGERRIRQQISKAALTSSTNVRIPLVERSFTNSPGQQANKKEFSSVHVLINLNQEEAGKVSQKIGDIVDVIKNDPSQDLGKTQEIITSDNKGQQRIEVSTSRGIGAAGAQQLNEQVSPSGAVEQNPPNTDEPSSAVPAILAVGGGLMAIGAIATIANMLSAVPKGAAVGAGSGAQAASGSGYGAEVAQFQQSQGNFGEGQFQEQEYNQGYEQYEQGDYGYNQEGYQTQAEVHESGYEGMEGQQQQTEIEMTNQYQGEEIVQANPVEIDANNVETDLNDHGDSLGKR